MVVAQDSGDPGTFLLFPYLQGPRDGGFAIQMLSARANLSQALRSRAVPATAATVLGCAVALWALGLAIDHPQGRGLTALLVALAATTAIAPGLAGPDHDLGRASAIAWPPRRATHVIVAGAAVVGVLAATALAGEKMADTSQIARNVARLVGLVALGASVLGAARAPLLPVVWTVLVLRYAPRWASRPPDPRTRSCSPGWCSRSRPAPPPWRP